MFSKESSCKVRDKHTVDTNLSSNKLTAACHVSFSILF